MLFTVVTTICPESFVYIVDGCYQVTPITYTWIDAVKACANNSAYLATINSSTLNTQLFNHISSLGLASSSIWIGLNDISKEGHYQWIDGSGKLKFATWHAGDPNDYQGVENCIVMLANAQGNWADIDCSNSFQALCKWNNTQHSTMQGKMF